MAKKIRLALVRCDTHGYYYGMLMARCDPLLVEKYNKIAHFYATDWYDPKHIILPTTYDFEIVKCYDANGERAAQFSEAFLGVQVCGSVEEMAEGIDAAFVGDCDGGGGDHLELAAPFLRRGIPTFVDKPFASTLRDAKEIVALAKRHRAPLYNSSILSEVIAADTFKRRFDEIGPAGANWTELAQAAVSLKCKPDKVGGVMLGVVKGVGGAISQENLGARDQLVGIEDRLAYIIHGIALAINVFGKGVEWVEAMGTLPLEYLHLHLASGRDVIILNTSVDVFPERCSFYVEAYSKMGAIHSGPIGDPEFLRGADRIVKKLRKMVRTGEPPVDYGDILEHIAVVEAGQRAQKTGSRVFLKNVLGGKAGG
ncbi:MAG: Gfo/Idh/MocA family oxidoreductase [Planctomycetota bacterium]